MVKTAGTEAYKHAFVVDMLCDEDALAIVQNEPDAYGLHYRKADQRTWSEIAA
jgi:hypothetical protein